MVLQRLTLAVILSVSLLSLRPSVARGQLTRSEANRLAVDVLTLHIGGDVRGVILDRSETEIHIAVRRVWLAEHLPNLLQALPDATPVSRQELVERIDAWLAELRAPDPGSGIAPPIQPGPDTIRRPDQQREMLRILKKERQTYRKYVDDPLALPPGDAAAPVRQAAYRELAKRLDAWIAQLEDASTEKIAVDDRFAENRRELIRILEKERETSAGIAPVEQPEATPAFCRLTLSRADVRQIFAQSDLRRKLAVAAFQAQLDPVESSTLTHLQQQLAARDIDWQNSAVDASQLVGKLRSQGDREWAARRAIYEYQFLSRLDFQGTGNALVQTGDEAPPPDLARLMQDMLTQQRAAALGDLLEEPIFTGLDFGGLGAAQDPQAGFKQATRTAERQGVRGLRITQVTPDLGRRQTIVEDHFLARMPDGSWETIWSVTKTISARNADQADLDRIKQDPQVKQIVGLAEGLGLAGGHLDLALQFGAATMNAQQATDDEFYEFRDRFTKRLDGPPLNWE
jgi:hypothetical protein